MSQTIEKPFSGPPGLIPTHPPQFWREFVFGRNLFLEKPQFRSLREIFRTSNPSRKNKRKNCCRLVPVSSKTVRRVPRNSMFQFVYGHLFFLSFFHPENTISESTGKVIFSDFNRILMFSGGFLMVFWWLSNGWFSDGGLMVF